MFCQQSVTIFLFKAIIVTNVRAADVLSAAGWLHLLFKGIIGRLHLLFKGIIVTNVQSHHRY